MDEGSGEGVIPRGVGVVEVGAGVECEVETTPPEIKVELVGVPRTGAKACSAEEGARVFSGQDAVRSKR